MKDTQPQSYSFSVEQANDNGVNINLEIENKKSSQWLNYLNSIPIPGKAIIIPGHVDSHQKPIPLTDTAKRRLDLAVAMFSQGQYAVMILSGGNVHPQGTPYNESMEMKRYLMTRYHVPEYYIAIEPFAENSVMNLKNSANFMFAHNIRKASIVTTQYHNFYFGLPYLLGFHLRTLYLLGYILGDLRLVNRNVTEFVPSKKISL